MVIIMMSLIVDYFGFTIILLMFVCMDVFDFITLFQVNSGTVVVVLPLGKENDLYLDGAQVTGLRPTPVISDSGVVMQTASFPISSGRSHMVLFRK